MGMLDEMLNSAKNSLKWKAESAAVGGVEKGIKSVFSKFKNRCPQCKKPITDTSAKFCPNCRANLVSTCSNPNCLRVLPLGTKFCPACGTKL